MNLLCPKPESLLPAGYLGARLRGRAGGYRLDWQVLLSGREPVSLLAASPAAAFLHADAPLDLIPFQNREYLWVYLMMNNCLRRAFQPFFLWHALVILIRCLRLRLAGDRTEAPAVIPEDTLLAPELVKMLSSGRPTAEIIAALEEILLPLSPSFRSVTETYSRGGIPQLEPWLHQKFLEYAADSAVGLPLRRYFTLLIDYHNLLGLTKAGQYRCAAPPRFIDGGTLTPVRLERALTGDPARLRAHPGLRVESPPLSPAAAVRRFLVHLDRQLRKQTFNHPLEGGILLYLWEVALFVRNLGTILAAAAYTRLEVEDGVVHSEGDR